MDKFLAIHALNQYMDIKALFDDNEGKTIDELYDIFCERYYNNVFNFDGELFDIELENIVATVFVVNDKVSLMERFDIYDDEGHLQVDYTVEELKKYIA